MLVAALLLAPSAGADFYRWTDADGVTHYTQDLDRVPRRYRPSVEIVREEESSRPTTPALPPPAPRLRPPEPPASIRGEERTGPPPAPGAGASPLAAPDVAAAAPGAQPPADVDPREAEVAQLERELAARREELKDLISQSSFDGSQLASDPRLRELAELVPRLQAELEALRGELER